MRNWVQFSSILVSHFYLILDSSEEIFDVLVGDLLEIIQYEPGDTITIEYTEGEAANIVLSIEAQ